MEGGPRVCGVEWGGMGRYGLPHDISYIGGGGVPYIRLPSAGEVPF